MYYVRHNRMRKQVLALALSQCGQKIFGCICNLYSSKILRKTNFVCSINQGQNSNTSCQFWPKTIWMYLQSLFLQDFMKNYAFCLFHQSVIEQQHKLLVLKITSCRLLCEFISHPDTLNFEIQVSSISGLSGQKNKFVRSFFGRSYGSTILFRDLLTFSF